MVILVLFVGYSGNLKVYVHCFMLLIVLEYMYQSVTSNFI